MIRRESIRLPAVHGDHRDRYILTDDQRLTGLAL
jgi:hypothetical protein